MLHRLALLVLVLLPAWPVPALAHEDLDDAIVEVTRAIEREPRSARLLLERGEYHRAHGALALALADYDRAEALDPSLPELDLCRGAAALDGGRPHEAARRLARYVARVPGDARAHELHARALEATGDPAGADLARGLARLARERAPRAPDPEPAAPAAPQAVLRRGPYLQRATPTSVVVRWRTDVATDSRVWVGSAPDQLTRLEADPAPVTEHVVVVDSLAPGARAFYAVGSASQVLAGGDSSCVLSTLPADGTARPVRIWSIGDSGLPGRDQRNVRDAFARWTGGRDPDVWLMLGDNAYNAGTDTEYQAGVFDAYPAQLRRLVLWPTRGNHDALYAGAGNDYYDLFTMPTAGESGGRPSGTEAWYSFDVANVHLICLDSEGSDRTVSGPMLTWLADDLATRRGDWTIAFWHHPPYTKGSHDSDNVTDSGGRMRDMRQNVLPLLEAAGADLALTGHSHSYERSMLLDGHYGLSSTLTAAMKVDPGDGRPDGDGLYHKPGLPRAPHEGSVYAVVGSSSRHDGGPLNHPAMIASLDVLGSMAIDIDGARLDARFLDTLGVVRDSFTVVKGTIASVDGGGDGRRAWMTGAHRQPAHGGASFTFGLPRAARARVRVFDVGGRVVAGLADAAFAAGAHEARWDGTRARGGPAGAGVYFAVLECEGQRVARRFVLLR